MRHGSLFSGIGGFDLSAQRMGWKNVFQVEIDPFCQKVLKKNFPNTKLYGDIRETDFTPYRGTIDIISGGFPCQPFSVAGLRKGKDDDRALWSEMCRAVREIKPRYVVGENVTGIISMELDSVCTDLENEGYTVQPFIIPASALNACHERKRVWIIAHANRQSKSDVAINGESFGLVANANRQSRRYRKECNSQREWKMGENQKTRRVQSSASGSSQVRTSYREFRENGYPSESPICRRDDGVSRRMDRNHTARMKALGNAIVPQVAFNIFYEIEQFHYQYFVNN